MNEKNKSTTDNENSSNLNKDSTTGEQNNSSIKLPYKALYWTALVSFLLLLIAGVVAAFVLIFKSFNNNIAIAICSCVIICCAFICATLLLIFSSKYLYNLKKASNQTKSTEILENAYMKCFQDKATEDKPKKKQ